MPAIVDMIKAIKSCGLESGVSLGSLTQDQAVRLKEAGVDYYNHNLDTSPEFYPKIISTRTYQDRLETLSFAHEAGIKLCCGGISGMGESLEDRINLLLELKSYLALLKVSH